MLLTIDAGNSMVKLAAWLSARIDMRQQVVVETELDMLPLFTDIDIKRVERIVVANVAGDEVEQALHQACRDADLPDPQFIEVSRECCGVRHGYRDPREHGVDRWAAVIAARQLEQAAVCVIDAGSAVTFDVLDASGQHRGGCISPGSKLSREQLKARFGIDSTATGSVLLADNTAAGVMAGCSAHAEGGTAKVIQGIRDELGETMSLMLTGGGAERLRADLEAAAEPGMRLHEQPDLVMQGLRAIAESNP